MADAVIEFVLNNLKELVDHHSHLIRDTREHIKILQTDLSLFKAFLEDSVEKWGDNTEQTKVVVKEIREVVYQVEDIIDNFVNKIIVKKRGIPIPKICRTPVDLHSIGQEVQKVTQRVQKARIDLELVKGNVDVNVKVNHEHTSQQSQERPPRKKDVVGFEDEAKDIIKCLTRETKTFEVTSLIGMVGLGKTTLAWKVFTDPVIIDKFRIRIWLTISQHFSDRDIFLLILNELTTVTEEIKLKSVDKIADLVIAHLSRGNFLIVMDDVWEPKDWSLLHKAMPKYKGKVLVTSRNESVGYATGEGSVKELHCFNDDHSWKLLRLVALNADPDCPPELEKVGRTIAKNCGGLPLAVVIVGGFLAAKPRNPNTNAMVREWKEVSNRVSTYLHENDPENRMRKFISLSYDRLPYHLRSCFLYLGMFPEDYEISASKLIRLWIGEGFIQQSESCSLEETAEKYLEELINRNLVKSEKFKHDGRVKSCRIHDTLRGFCRIEAANENLVKEIKWANGIFKPPISDINKYRRLSINSKCLEFISEKPSCPHARSFFCFSKDKFEVNDKNSEKIFAAFKFLKVLDVEPFEFQKIDSVIYQLFSMRYLVLSCDKLSILSPKFSQLWNIQTLVFNTTSRILEVKVDIWKMNKLKYFKTNAAAILPKPSKRSKHGKELQTLGTISVKSCTPELFNRAINLKKVGIRGDLSSVLEGIFNSLGKMELIEKLKLVHDIYPYPSRQRPLPRLPQHDQFPSGLMSLTLRATFLNWDAMSTLGLLKKLEVLKLKENAFMGPIWNAVKGGFERLQLLHIEETDLIVWNATSLHYPKLRSLVLRNCKNLIEIPIGMADIQSLQSVELYYCDKATEYAKAINEAKKNTHPQGRFMLYIFSARKDRVPCKAVI